MSTARSALVGEWDKGSRPRRVQILKQIIHAHKNSTASDIERELGASSMLIFMRMTAWLRLTYQLKQDIATQLAAISLFIQGQRYLTHFLEVGGVQTLCDLLCQSSLKAVDKQNALLILIHIANSGRVYREIICDAAGVDLIIQSLLKETNEASLEMYGSLFMALGQGNPRKVSLVHAGLVFAMSQAEEPGALLAATTLRSLQLAKQYYSADKSASAMFPSITKDHSDRRITSAGGSKPKINITAAVPVSSQIAARRPPSAARNPSEEIARNSLLDALFALLSKESVKLRFEGTELLVIAAQNSDLVSAVTNRLLDVIDREVSRDEDEDLFSWHLSPAQRQQACAARVLSRIIVGGGTEPNTNQEPIAREDVARILERRAAHVNLLRLGLSADGKDLDTQREVGACLQQLLRCEARFDKMRRRIVQSIGEDLCFSMSLAKDLDIDFVKQFRKALEENAGETDAREISFL